MGDHENQGEGSRKDARVSNELSFYPYFPADFDSSTRHLSAEQVGVYQRLLNWSWLNGPLPKDPLSLRNIAGATHQPWEDLWPVLAGKFCENGAGLINGRLEEERAKVRAKRQARSEAGKLGAAAKWQKDGDAIGDATGDANGKPMPSKLKAKAKPRSQEPEPRPLPPALDAPEFAAKWAEWEGYRREIRKKLTPTSRSRQLAALEKVGVTQAIAALDLSMQNGWTGVFPEKVGKGKTRPARMTAGKVETYGGLGFE